MGISSSRGDVQNRKICLSQHVLDHFAAQTAARSEFFPIAAKTMKYVCYNSADNSMNETLFVPSINSDKDFRVNHVGTFIWW